jgi:hypothetical protein
MQNKKQISHKINYNETGLTVNTLDYLHANKPMFISKTMYIIQPTGLQPASSLKANCTYKTEDCELGQVQKPSSTLCRK